MKFLKDKHQLRLQRDGLLQALRNAKSPLDVELLKREIDHIEEQLHQELIQHPHAE